jgi:hypothetical protein
MDNLKYAKKYQENRNTLITLYFYETTKENAISFIQKELNKCSTIQNTSIKNKLNNRLYELKLKIEKMNDDILLSMIYLLHDEIIEHKFNENEKQVFIDFKLKPINIWNDEIFQIDYLIDLFYDFNFYYSCVVQKNQFIIKKINSTKNKVLNQIKFSNEKTLIENINQVINEQKITELYIHSNHNLIKALINEKNKKYICFEQELNDNEVLVKIKNTIYEKNNQLLEKKLNELNNPNTNLDVFVFGFLKKEILSAIECYSLKELYIEERKLVILKECLDDSFFNFKIIPIVSTKNGDIASQFIKNYKGLMGIKYF